MMICGARDRMEQDGSKLCAAYHYESQERAYPSAMVWRYYGSVVEAILGVQATRSCVCGRQAAGPPSVVTIDALRKSMDSALQRRGVMGCWNGGILCTIRLFVLLDLEGCTTTSLLGEDGRV